MVNNNSYKYINLILVTQAALLDEVVPSLRGVAVDWDDNTILAYFYNDGEISEELRNDYSCIGTEIVSNYSTAHISEKIIRLDYPAKLPKHEHWVYRRKEVLI